MPSVDGGFGAGEGVGLADSELGAEQLGGTCKELSMANCQRVSKDSLIRELEQRRWSFWLAVYVGENAHLDARRLPKCDFKPPLAAGRERNLCRRRWHIRSIERGLRERQAGEDRHGRCRSK